MVCRVSVVRYLVASASCGRASGRWGSACPACVAGTGTSPSGRPGDGGELDVAWVVQVVGFGLQWGQREHVTNIGFGAKGPSPGIPACRWGRLEGLRLLELIVALTKDLQPWRSLVSGGVRGGHARWPAWPLPVQYRRPAALVDGCQAGSSSRARPAGLRVWTHAGSAVSAVTASRTVSTAVSSQECGGVIWVPKSQ